jgi:hypothetical protein
MSNYLIVGTAGANIVMGTADIGYTAIGTIISGGNDREGSQLVIPDRYGNEVAVVYFNLKNKCTIDVIFDSTVILPALGDALSLMNLTNVLCDKVSLKWANDKEKMVTIEATKRDLLATS